MLLPDMTPGAKRALLAGLAWKQATSSDSLSPTHVLLGLLHEEEGTPAQRLAKQNIDRTRLLQHFQLPEMELTIPEELTTPPDSLIQVLLYQARLVALETTGNPQVNSEQLLLTLLETLPTFREQLKPLGYEHHKLTRQLSSPSFPSLKLEQPLRLIDSQETLSLSRILDANANRAREALRVLEELARFHLNDAYLTRLAKELRHELTQVMACTLPIHLLLRSRETAHDVGTGITTSSESYRPSLRAVLEANAQRLQEALRSLEEYGKVASPEFGSAVEKLRYQSYTLQRCLFISQHAKDTLAGANLYLLVSKSTCVASLEWTIKEAAAGGVGIVQLREKNKTDRELLAIAREVREVTHQCHILFIMNDRPDLARLSQADGVHLGQDDLDILSARTILGPDALIGVSTHNLKQLETAIQDGADYVGLGPTFPSKTKSFDVLAGLDFLRQTAATTSLPAYAIGGIDPTNVDQVVQAGLRRVAVGNAITQAQEPREVAQQMLARLKPNCS